MPVLFQSTHSLRSATLAHSGHRKRAVFQSTHSLRSATQLRGLHGSYPWGFNPRTPCGVRRHGRAPDIRPPPVSIHALLAECDSGAQRAQKARGVSIHALLAECDPATGTTRELSVGFQSTHSLRSATSWTRAGYPAPPRFNPRTPCGVRRAGRDAIPGNRRFQSTHSLRSATRANLPARPSCAVSIHALLAECD